ncbi:potassium channel family protein [Dolosigranulum pigrum]|jgi:potassium uptake protein, K+ transporter (trk) family|uniref:potassium channel family protein n=1 Tax=Dolosigranulum pigrum TaxID=29394 RepID=UPI001AD88DB0|nr:TrkA family potassium uptake protein [Dolosigranulum pigrum]QTJ34051.1 TrkA family potassium uptake protein [Dolosigranulum pigrum]QTJ39225.1 TrkA family potassium uptake protein [Dolosigranulum pigrum]QTJ47716.1 TrkA family potassium uptake protein [Dolosigranulum pigrum]QTJ57943.1 TrkA family potassium uptake protein [Dolosigranulum pigrum]
MRRTIGVLGLGVFGRTVVKELTDEPVDIITIDKDKTITQRIESYVLEAVIGDFTDMELIKSVGIAQCETVIIATASSLESSVIATLNCKNLGIKNIIVKVKNKRHREIMEQLGATEVIRPEYAAGLKLSKQLRNPNIRDVIDLEDDVSIVEFTPPKKWLGKSIKELDLRSEFGLNIIGIKSAQTNMINYNLAVDSPLDATDILVAIGNKDDIEEFDYVED